MLEKPSTDELAASLRALEVHPRDAAAYSRAGLLHDRAGDPRVAVDLLRHAVSLAPARAQWYDELGMVLRHAAMSVDGHVGRRRGPRPQPAPQRVPGGDDPCWRRAEPTCFPLEHYAPTQLHIAEEDFLRRVGADDNDLHGFALLAQLYYNRSTDACVAALRLDPSRPSAYLTLARQLPRGGALGLYRHALGLLPTMAALYREFGERLVELRYYAQANTAYRTSVALDPSAPAGYEALAQLRLDRWRPAEAIAIARQALALHPEAPDPPTSADELDAVARVAADELPSERLPPAQPRADAALVPPPMPRQQAEPPSKAQARRQRRAAQAAQDAAARAAASHGALAISAAISLLAEGHCQQRRFAEAASLGRVAVAITPSSARGYTQLGHALYELATSVPARARDGGRPTTSGRGWASRLWPMTDAVADDGRYASAIAACESATQLTPLHPPTSFRLATLLRRVPGRLQESIQHYNRCLLGKSTYPGAREAQEEAVATMRELQRPKRGLLAVVGNLLPVLMLLGAMSHFAMR